MRIEPTGCVPVTVTFSYITDTYQEFVVPAGHTSATIECWGAEGSNAVFGSAPAGKGGYIKAVNVPVTPGETLRIYLGEHTSNENGGFNGGGEGGVFTSPGGGGGGGTDVRRAPYGLADRLVVAGGGGGPGAETNNDPGAGEGGDGGYAEGEDGDPPSFGNGVPGHGGTQTAGGTSNSTPRCFFGTPLGAQPGALGVGGDAENGSGCTGPGCGGGGGGYYGGGGGQQSSLGTAGSGGGGGSSAVLAGTLADYSNGTRSGHGQAAITFHCAADFNPILLPWDWLLWADPNTGYPNAAGPPWPRSWTTPSDGGVLAAWPNIIVADTGDDDWGSLSGSPALWRASVGAFNNEPTVELDGSDQHDFERFGGITRNQPFTFISIMRYTGPTSSPTGRALWWTAGSTAWNVAVTTDGGPGLKWRMGGSSNVYGSAVDSSPHLLIFEVNGSSSNIELDGTTTVAGPASIGSGSLSPGSPGFKSLTLGAFASLNGTSWQGDIALAGVIPRLLTTDERDDLIAWSQGFYGTP